MTAQHIAVVDDETAITELLAHYLGTHGFRTIQATEPSHPYAGHYWPVGHIIGYEHTFINLVADALTTMHEGKAMSPNMEDGYQNQRVLDAVERSHESRSWVSL